MTITMNMLYVVELGQTGGMHAFSAQMLDAKSKLKIDNLSPMWLAHDNDLSAFYISSVDPDLVEASLLAVHPISMMGLMSEKEVMFEELPLMLPWERHNHMIGAYINLMHYFYGHNLTIYHHSVSYCRVLSSTVDLMSGMDATFGSGSI